MTKDTLEVSVTIAGSTEKVWDTLVHVSLWWEDVTLIAEKGGTFQEVWHEGGEEKNASGHVISFVPNEELAISWSEPDWLEPMIFTFTLKPAGSGHTKVTLTEQDWAIFPGAIRHKLKQAHSQGWQYHLQALRYATES